MKPTEIARKTIESYFNREDFELDENTKNSYSDKKACFVTLNKKNSGELRGCIGNLQPIQELWECIKENAINAAFKDPRFKPLSKEELDEIKIEVSVLSKPERLEFENEKDLLNKLSKDMGLILKKGLNQSTFLPQVWEQLQDKVEFLEQLSLKAGLDKDAWKDKETELFYYKVKKFEED